jgi:fructokinase
MTRLGIDLGGTKTEIIALAAEGGVALRRRIGTPRDYDSLIRALGELVQGVETELGARGTVGMAIPGSESFGSNLIKNANTTYLIGKPLRRDLENILARPVRLANDANCFALSEASDGAAAGAAAVFGVIAGTGVGGGVVIGGKVLGGAHGIGGEWGHIPLPAPSLEEITIAPLCYCGKRGCLEVWCSGPGLAQDFKRVTGRDATAEQIAESNGAEERAALTRLIDRLARAMATLVNILDPDVIVMGGGLSNIDRLYGELPPLVEKYGFNLGGPPRIVKNMHGDSSGVRGAAWLWSENGA